MEQDQFLDDKYTEGVWYDAASGGFCELEEAGVADGVHLINTETGEVYYEIPAEDWPQEQSDFHRVSEEAQKHPEAVVNRGFHMLMRNDPNELMSISFDKAIDLRYARKQVSISED